ncbi:MAG: cysteine synthase A, partial [Magnetospirillum sp.]|nr:cysteine synthase A [Magnetospirillum sp.]
GAALFNYYAFGELRAEGSSVSEGIGQNRITANLEGVPIDKWYQATDEEGLAHVYSLMEHEGLCLGLSSGINVAGAEKLARDLGPGRLIVTILCDSGRQYLSKIFNPEWLRARNLPTPPWMNTPASDQT